MTTDTRRTIVQRLIANGVKSFALRPMAGDEAQRQEVVVLTPDEALWSLPCCDDTPTVTTITVYTIVNANIRSTPVVAGDTNKVPPGVAAGSALVVEQTPIKDATGRDWYRIAAGQFAGNYVAVEVTGPKA